MFVFVTLAGSFGALYLWSTLHAVLSSSVALFTILSLIVAAWLWSWSHDHDAALVSLGGSAVALAAAYVGIWSNGTPNPWALALALFGVFCALPGLKKRRISFGDLFAVYGTLCLLLFVMSGLCGLIAQVFGYEIELVFPWSPPTPA